MSILEKGELIQISSRVLRANVTVRRKSRLEESVIPFGYLRMTTQLREAISRPSVSNIFSASIVIH